VQVYTIGKYLCIHKLQEITAGEFELITDAGEIVHELYCTMIV